MLVSTQYSTRSARDDGSVEGPVTYPACCGSSFWMIVLAMAYDVLPNIFSKGHYKVEQQGSVRAAEYYSRWKLLLFWWGESDGYHGVYGIMGSCLVRLITSFGPYLIPGALSASQYTKCSVT